MNENVIMMCFHKGTLVFRYALVMSTLYFSHFCTSFFTEFVYVQKYVI